ncbi:MAG TPA: MBL fold metallo-hydrolase [Candidatus Obscuribacterales bacterium]
MQKSRAHVFKEIRPHLFQIAFHHPASTNCWLFEEKDGLTLVDAAHPWHALIIMGAVEHLGRPLKRIVITHAHPDHAGAAAELSSRTGADVFAHESEVGFLQGRGCMAELDGFWLCRAILKTGHRFGMLNPPAIENVCPLVDGDTVGSLKVIHTPGHTPGSISLWSQQARGIFCGDNVLSSFNVLHLGMPWFTLDGKTLRQSLKRYAELPAQLLLPGHGPVYCREHASRDVLRLVARR